jgi:hypothetical protein
LNTKIRRNLLEVMGWEAFDSMALEGWMGGTDEDIVEDTTRWTHYHIFGSLARGSLGILPAF